MTISIETLTQRCDNFETNGGYKQNAMPEIYTYYNEFIVTGKYPYNREVADFIKARETIPEHLHKYLDTEVYLCSQQLDRERRFKNTAEMLSQGWQVLNVESANKLNGKQIEVSATQENNLFTGKITGIFKVFVVNDKYPYLMKPRATRKGIAVIGIDNAFYKEV